jgi:hypothetical protein
MVTHPSFSIFNFIRAKTPHPPTPHQIPLITTSIQKAAPKQIVLKLYFGWRFWPFLSEKWKIGCILVEDYAVLLIVGCNHKVENPEVSDIPEEWMALRQIVRVTRIPKLTGHHLQILMSLISFFNSKLRIQNSKFHIYALFLSLNS